MKTKELVLSALCLVHGARRVLMVALCAVGLAAWADGTGTKDDPWTVGAAPDAGCVTASMANYGNITGGHLSFWGDGAMKDFTQGGAPWSSVAESVRGVYVYNQVTSIGAFAFAGCPLDRAGVNILAPVEMIGESAFAGCTGLKSVKIPKSVTSIGASAFAGCIGLTQVEIPKAVTAIGEGAFKDCASLSRVSVRAAVPPSIGKDAFPKDNLVAIDVPAGSMEAYGQADGWKEYADLFQPVYDLSVMEGLMPATDGFSRTRDADGNVLLVIEKPGLVVTGTTKHERIQLNAESVTLDDLTIDVATNCVVTYRTAPTTVIIGYPMKETNHNRHTRKVSAQGPVRLYADGAQNACIVAGNGGLVIKNNGKLVARANGDVPAIRADGDITIVKAGRLDCRADKAPAIDAGGKLTFASISAGTVLRGGKGGAISAADALVLPDKEGWSFLGAADADAPVTGLLAPVTVRKAAGSDVYTGYVGADVAKAVTFAKMTEVKSPADFFSWGADSADFKHPAAPHGKFLAAPADAMIAEYDARIAKDPTDYGARICRAFAYMKKAGENEAFDRLAQEFGFTFDNDTMHFTGELIHKKGETPEMNDVSAEVCDIVLPLLKAAYDNLDAIPDNWKGSLAITPDLYPVDEEVYFDCADVFCAKAALAEMLCVLNMVKGFDMTLDSDLLPYTFNSRSPKNGKRGVQPILDNNLEFFSKVRDQKAATEAGDWWSAAARNLDAWDKAHAKRSDGKQHFFMWDFAKLDYKGVTGVDWLRTHRDGLINLPYWASPFDWTLMNGDQNQFWTLQPLFAGMFLRKHFPEFGVGVKEPWCNEPMLDTLPDSTLCGMFPGVSRTYIGDLMTNNKRGAGDFTTIPPYTPNSTSSVHAIWYDNLFELGFANTGNPAFFAWDNVTPITLLDPEFNVRGVTAVFTGWSFSGYPSGSPATWEGSEMRNPYTKESPMYKRRNVVATANFTIPQVTYLDFDGTSGKMVERTDDCELVKAETTTFEAGKVYAVVRDVTIANRITVSGTPASPTRLVLCDGVTLAAMNGIDVSAGKALVICGQALGTGTLEATGSAGAAGIGGGGIITINGGTVMAAGGSSSAGINGTVTINGGTVTAAGSDGTAGIGGTVKFADGIAYGVAAGADEANALYKTAAAYAADPSAAYVALPYFSLKIPEAAGYSYEVSSMGVHPTAALANQTNTYAIAAGATARVNFTLKEDYEWVKAPEYNPMILANISGDTVVDAGDLPTVKFVKKGSEENPWTVGTGVTAYIDENGTLHVEGEGDMKDFDPSSDPAPWGTDITSAEIGEGVTGIGANAFNDSHIGSATIPASVTNIGAAAFFCSTSLSNVVINAMTPPALGEGAFVEVAEGYRICVPTGTGAAYKAAPDWSLYADSIVEQGTPECPWTVGTPNASDVTAYTDGEGKLVIEGSGNMKDFDPSSHPAPWGTGLAEVEIGEGVTGIGAKAFAGCASLSNVTVKAKTPPALGVDAFAGTAEGLKIAVPFGTGAAYKAAPGWSDFADSIVEPGSPECPWTVGTGVTAYIDENGTLHVEGEGNMKDFTAADPAPWGASAADIKSIEIGEGVTKVGNAAFDSLDYKATTTALTFQDEDHVLNLLAFVSADGSKTNAPLATAFSVYKDSSGTVEPIVAYQTLDLVYVYTKAPTLMRYGYDEVLLLTLPDLKAVQTEELIGAAGETPYSKTMQGLLDEALDKIDKATNFDEVMDGYAKRLNQIVAQAEKDKTHEIEGTDITWRILDGTLVVEGEGDMKDFDPSSDPAPWGTDITSAEIGEGVTSVGANAFNDSHIGSATIPASVTNIGAAAFFCSTSLSNVVVEAKTPPALGEGAFVEVAEGYRICVPTGTGAAYKAAPDWSLYADHIVEQGSPEYPWEIGEGVEAYLNGTELVIQGTGTITDLSEIPDSVKDGLTAITVTEPTVTGAAEDAFEGIDGIALTLPDGWQGELPDERDTWYGATGATMEKWPLAVKNVKVQQRYPWNGKVDIKFALTGEGDVKVKLSVTVDGKKLANPTVTGETTFDLGKGGELKDLKLIWDAGTDFGDAELHQKIKVKLTIEKGESD